MCKRKTIKFDLVGEQPATNDHPNQLNILRRVEKLHRLRPQPMFPENFLNLMARTILFFQPELPAFP